jgi:hypothetical protein
MYEYITTFSRLARYFKGLLRYRDLGAASYDMMRNFSDEGVKVYPFSHLWNLVAIPSFIMAARPVKASTAFILPQYIDAQRVNHVIYTSESSLGQEAAYSGFSSQSNLPLSVAIWLGRSTKVVKRSLAAAWFPFG